MTWSIFLYVLAVVLFLVALVPPLGPYRLQVIAVGLAAFAGAHAVP